MDQVKKYRIAWAYDQKYKGNGSPITLELANAWINHFKDAKNNPWNIYHFVEIIE
jgi:hypothetical protein